LKEVGRSVKFGDFAGTEHNYPIRIENCVDTMSNGDDGAVLEDATAQSFLQEGIGLDVYGCCCLSRQGHISKGGQGWGLREVNQSNTPPTSSKTKMLLGVSIARETESNCLWPCDKFDPPSWTAASNPPGILDT